MVGSFGQCIDTQKEWEYYNTEKRCNVGWWLSNVTAIAEASNKASTLIELDATPRRQTIVWRSPCGWTDSWRRRRPGKAKTLSCSEVRWYRTCRLELEVCVARRAGALAMATLCLGYCGEDRRLEGGLTTV